MIQTALAAGPDQNAFAVVRGSGFGDEFGGIGAGVVDGDERDSHFVAQIQEVTERAQGGLVGLDRQSFLVVFVGELHVANETNNQSGVGIFRIADRRTRQRVRTVCAQEKAAL